MSARRRLLLAAAAIADVGLLAGFAWGWWHRHPHQCADERCDQVAICTERHCGPGERAWCPEHAEAAQWSRTG